LGPTSGRHSAIFAGWDSFLRGGKFLLAGSESFTFSRPGPEWIANPARQGFMSAQRRAYRSTPAAMTCRVGFRWRSQLTCSTACAGASSPTAQCGRGGNSGDGRTAPPVSRAKFHPGDKDPSPGAPELKATTPLRSDDRMQRLLRIVRLEISRGFSRASTRTPESTRFSPPPSLLPLHFRSASPQIPAGPRRRAERYDGKGNMYLLHAA